MGRSDQCLCHCDLPGAFQANYVVSSRAYTDTLVCFPDYCLVDQPTSCPRSHQLTTKQTIFLRKLSRKTWAFFENYVDIEDHWLPPDNYQEHLTVEVAHRTSPTNIGLALLANLAAYDFGYLPTGQLIGRIESTFGTMESLERYQGHFYNWYDTLSLQPLPPLYISTVDSGNLAGHPIDVAFRSIHSSRS